MSPKSLTKLKGLLSNGDEVPSFAQLQDIEKRRRAILLRTEEPFWKILSYWDGTCLYILVRDPLFWLTIIVYAAIRTAAYTADVPEHVTDIDPKEIGVIGGFLSFFLVFFVVSSNNRLNTLYGESMKIKGRIFDVSSTVAVSFPRERALRIVRYMNAAHIVAYVGLSDVYHSTTFFKEINKKNVILTEKELNRINEIDMDAGGNASRECVVWAMREVHKAQKDKIIDDIQANFLREQLLALRGAIGSLYNFHDQPVPFFYIHFISLLSALYLPLFAMSAAYGAGAGEESYWLSDVLAGLIVIVQAIFVIGLRLLGQKMIDPYGDDVEDLSVMHYVNFTWANSNRILEAEMQTQETDADLEEEIFNNRTSIGNAWKKKEDVENFTTSTKEKETLDLNLTDVDDSSKSSLWRQALEYPTKSSL